MANISDKTDRETKAQNRKDAEWNRGIVEQNGRGLLDPRDIINPNLPPPPSEHGLDNADNFDNTRDPQEIYDDNLSQYTTGRPV